MKRIKSKKVRNIVNTAGKPSKTDVLGMYTGNPVSKSDKPLQDADDL